MQGLVTPRFIKRKRKVDWLRIFSIVAAVILIIILIITVPDKKRDKNFEEVAYYFVYADKSPKENVILSKKDMLKSLGGGAVSYYFRNEYYLIANVYLSKEYSSEIEKGMIESFSNAGVISFKSKEPSISKIQEYKKKFEIFEYFEFLYDFIEKFDDLQLSYLAGSVSEIKVCKEVTSRHLKLQEIISRIESIEKNDKIEYVIENAKQCDLIFKNFLNKFFDSTKKSALVCEFFINIVFCRLELFDNL